MINAARRAETIRHTHVGIWFLPRFARIITSTTGVVTIYAKVCDGIIIWIAPLSGPPSSSTSLCFPRDNNDKDLEDPPTNNVVQTEGASFEERTGLRGLFPAVSGPLLQRVHQESKEIGRLDEKTSEADDDVV